MIFVSCNFYLSLLQGVRIIFLRMSNNQCHVNLLKLGKNIICSDEGLTLEMSGLETLHNGQFTINLVDETKLSKKNEGLRDFSFFKLSFSLCRRPLSFCYPAVLSFFL